MLTTSLLTLLLSASVETSTLALTLREAIELAIATSPELAGAELERDRAELQAFRARLHRFRLTVDAEVQELLAKSNLGSTRGDGTDGLLGLSNVTANVTVPLFAGFGIESSIDRALHLVDAAKSDVEEQERTTGVAVARAYWAAKKLALLSQVAEAAVDRIRAAEAIAAARLAAGLAPPIDESRIRARRLLQQSLVADLSGAARQANSALAVLLGLRQEITLLDRTRPRGPPPGDLARLLETAFQRRGQLKAAQARMDAQRSAIEAAQASYYPKLSAYGLAQYGNNPSLAGAGARAVFGSGDPFAKMALDLQAGVILSVNLFDTLETSNAVKEARLEAAQLVTLSEQAQRAVDAEVRGAHARVGRFFALFSGLTRTRGLAEENVLMNQKRYEAGEAQVIELLESEMELVEVERRLAEAEAELTLAWLELEAAMGSSIGDKS